MSVQIRPALKRDTGARALRAVVEELMLDLMYELPEHGANTKYLIDCNLSNNSYRLEADSRGILRWANKIQFWIQNLFCNFFNIAEQGGLLWKCGLDSYVYDTFMCRYLYPMVHTY